MSAAGTTSPVRIAPSILSADFGHLAAAVQEAEAGGADWIHIDVMDGLFVPNITLGPPVVQAIRRATKLFLDVHLMIENPSRYLTAFRDAGADGMTIHIEADRHPYRTLEEIRRLGGRAGLALNPGTPISHAADLVHTLDMLLVMSVNPGFGGQAFIPQSLDRLERARDLVQSKGCAADIEVDGGIKPANIRAAVSAGATVVVAGSSVFEGGSIRSNLSELRGQLRQD